MLHICSYLRYIIRITKYTYLFPCIYLLTSITITTAGVRGWKKDKAGYLDRISFSSESLEQPLALNCWLSRPYAMCTYVLRQHLRQGVANQSQA
jgi:hypothetical protein